MSEVKDLILSSIKMNQHLYVKDLEAIPEEQFTASPGGCARAVCDFTFEVASVNQRFAMSLRGETPPEQNEPGWMMAPPEYRSKAAAIQYFKDCTEELIEAYSAADEERLSQTIEGPVGPMSLLHLGSLASHHMMYHGGQVTYVQCLHGDDVMHWM